MQTIQNDSVLEATIAAYTRFNSLPKELLKHDWQVGELQVTYEAHRDTFALINNSSTASIILQTLWDKDLINSQRQCSIMLLNENKEVMGFRSISIGDISKVKPDIKLIVVLALITRASSIIVARNQTIGTPMGTTQDLKLISKIKKCLSIFNLHLDDYIILNSDAYISLL